MRWGVLVLLVFSGVVFLLVFGGLGLVSEGDGYPGGRVLEVVFDPTVSPRWECTVSANSTHVVYVCTAERPVRRLVFEDGGELDHWDLWRRFGTAKVNCRRVEVADLASGRYLVYELYDLTPFGFGVHRRVVEEGSFSYRRVKVPLSLYGSGVRRYDPSEGDIKLYIAVFTFGERFCNRDYTICNYTFAPAPPEIAWEYARLAEEYWCSIVEWFLGLNCTVAPVDPVGYCEWPRTLSFKAQEGMVAAVDPTVRFKCGRLNGLDIITVVELPGWLGEDLRGIYYHPTKCIVVGYYRGYRRSPGFIFLHEFGHAIGLHDLYYDVNPSVLDPSVPPWARGIAEKSIMFGGRSITVLDAAATLYALYEHLEGYGLGDWVSERLARYGFDPRNRTIILPFTGDGRVPPPLDKLLTAIVKFRYDPFEERVVVDFNHHTPRILEAIAKHATTQHTTE